MGANGALSDFIVPGYRYLAYLPLAHIMELAVEVTLMGLGWCIGYGSTGTLTPNSPKMLHPNQQGDGQALRPDILVAAPAVLDRVYTVINQRFAAKKGIAKKLIDGGLASGKANFDKGGKGASGILTRFIFKKRVASLLGGKVKLILTGSAPLGRCAVDGAAMEALAL